MEAARVPKEGEKVGAGKTHEGEPRQKGIVGPVHLGTFCILPPLLKPFLLSIALQVLTADNLAISVLRDVQKGIPILSSISSGPF